MILVVSHEQDDHTPQVMRALEQRGADAFLLDLARLPRSGTVSLSYGRPGRRVIQVDGRTIESAEVTAVWWRRPQPMVPPEGIHPEWARFAVQQVGDAVMGLVASLRGRALLVNDPFLNEYADHKTFQLDLAERLGLRIPATLVTGDPTAARDFLDSLGGRDAVHKTVDAATPSEWRLTRKVKPRDLDRLEALRLAPVIIQEHVPGIDVRVTVVGEELFAAQFDARATTSPDDYRQIYADCRVSPCQLPPTEEAGLRRMMKQLGLLYAAADFRIREDGAWFFLEVNVGGQWDYVEQCTGQPITEALAALLTSSPRGEQG